MVRPVPGALVRRVVCGNHVVAADGAANHGTHGTGFR